jgi:Fe-S oxidoreductase
MAAVTVLEDAGWRVEIPAGDLCCGLTWVSTGQLGVAKKVLSRTPGAGGFRWSDWSRAVS